MRADDARSVLDAAPIRSFEEIAGAGPILVLAPHPDDESLGCGGLIAEACARGRDIFVAILTGGGKSHPGSLAYPAERLIATRAGEVRDAVSALGLAPDRLILMNEPDGAAPVSGPMFEAAVETLRALLVRHGVTTVFAAWRADPHGDHLAASDIAAAACARAGARHVSYPIWFWTLADETEVPDPSGRAMRMDVARHLPAKRAAIACHASQLGHVIEDDPEGFVLKQEFLALFDQPTEVFILES